MALYDPWKGNPVSTPAPAQLNRIYAAVNYLADLEGQDHTLVIEMSQAMLDATINGEALLPMVEIVRRYCDVIDGPADAERIAAEIEAEI